jgi:hypothetical protein
MAWVRAFIAVARATRSERIISTCPLPALGVAPWWAWTARAAASASKGSDLPRRHRAGRSVGAVDLDHDLAVAVQEARQPGPEAADAFDPPASISPRCCAQLSSSP